MSKKKEYTSDNDSEQSNDEDYCPGQEKAVEDSSASASATASEESNVEGESDESDNQPKKVPKLKRKTLNKKRNSKKQDSSDDDEEDNVGTTNSNNTRSTRQAEAGKNGHQKHMQEKDEIESDEETKSRTDALWADFLNDVNPTKSKSGAVSKCSTADKQSYSSSSKTETTNGNNCDAKKLEHQTDKSEKITVTEILDFAGESVCVEKTVNADSIKENKTGTTAKSKLPNILKRPAAGGSGLGSILNQIGKKKKISVLEKSKLDWNSFKNDEGIDEELQTHNKGKDGYLEKQDFLQRTDLRQFEIEKNLRQSRRNQ